MESPQCEFCPFTHLLWCALAGENAIVIVAGANMLLGNDELQKALPAIRHAKVLVCQLEISPQTSLQALHMAQQNKGQSRWCVARVDLWCYSAYSS